MHMTSSSNYDLLIDKLDVFIRKFYTNKLIRGSLYWIALTLVIFLLYSILEYNFYFSTGVRKFLFFSFLATVGAGLVYWIGLPLSRIFHFGSRISHEQAAAIIGEHFTDVRDKLLNVLQLHRQVPQSTSPELALASIEQKTDAIKLVPFRNAIDLSKNRKCLRYALPPMLVLLALLVAAPSVVRDSTTRIIHNNKSFERSAPFQFLIAGDEDLSVIQHEDFNLAVTVDGSALPNEVFIQIDNYQYRMKKESPTEFSYRFKNVHKDMPFVMYSGRVSSEDKLLKVLKKPNLISFGVHLDYPAYTGRKDETLQNIGDLVIPAGTQVTWDFKTMNTDDVLLRFSDEEVSPTQRQGNDLFTMRRRVTADLGYTMFLSNAQLPVHDSIRYAINVIPDLYPTISVEQFVDSSDTRLVYFLGSAGDDYGVSALSFHYQLTDAQGQAQPEQTIPLRMPQGSQFQFTHTLDIAQLQIAPGQELTYYFEVRDNDAVNGSKSTRSSVMKYRKPTIDEFAEQEKENNDAIKQSLSESLKESQRLQEELRKLREKLLQENQVEWQQKKEIEKLMERQKAMQEQMRNSGDLMRENRQNQEEFSQPSDKLMEKQEKLQDLFDKLMSDELRELMEKFGDQMDLLEKNEALQMLEKFEMSEEELQKELDRLLELFKQMEIEQEMQRQIDKLEQMAEEQETLSEKTEQQKEQNESLQEQQKDLQEKLDGVKKDMESIEKKNSALERPKNLEGAEEQLDKIDQDMQNSQEQLQQNQNQKSSQSQKNAAQRMRDLAQQMASQMQQGEMDQMQEDMATLRQLLENLLTLSFEQEDLIDQLDKTAVTTPRYVSLVQNQFKIKDDFRVVEDTLQALSKRVLQIESFITEKVTEIKSNLQSGLRQLEDRQKAQAADHQHRTMKNLNDLALMLSEVMNQMQQQMASMMPGSQMCNKPGGQGQGKSGRVPMDKITEGQQQLSEEMKQKMQGRKQGQGHEGEGGMSSEDFARMAARQAALRKALRDIHQDKQQRGQGDELLQQIMEEMDKVETQLVNKQLTNEMMKRQQEILTRLLQAERAEREREMDNERKAEQARQTERTVPPALEEYMKKREAEIESFRTASPVLRPYYKFLVEEYYNALKNQ